MSAPAVKRTIFKGPDGEGRTTVTTEASGSDGHGADLMSDQPQDVLEAAPIHITMIGEVAFATPTPKPILTTKQWEAIERALMAAAEGRLGAAEVYVRRVERRIWPRGFDPHHELRVSRSAEALRKRQAAPQPAPEPVTPTSLPDRERGRGERDIARFDRAKAELTSPRLVLTENQRDARAQIMRTIEDEPHKARDRAWLEAARQETLDLAKARGEETEDSPSRPARIKSRDGLRTLFERERLTKAEYDTAKTLRDAYEKRAGDVGSQLGALSAGGAHNNDRFVALRALRAIALEDLGNVERRVAMDLRTTPAALQMLRAVVGEGVSLSAFGEGRSFVRNLEALKAALDIAERELEAARKRRGQQTAA